MKIINQLKVVIIIAAISVAIQAQAATYYVSPTGSDGNAGTSQAEAFRTIQKGADTAKAGDTVRVSSGTYNEVGINQRNDGTSSARIRFVSEDPWGAKLVSRSRNVAFSVFGDYVDVEGFDVTGDSNAHNGIVLYGSNTRALYNHVHDLRAPICGSNGGSGVGTADYTSSNKEIIGNVVHHIGTAHLGSAPYCNKIHGIYAAVPKIKVQNNITYKNASAGIHLWHIPDNNLVSNNLSFSNRGTGIIFGAGNAPGGVANNIMVSNNIFMFNEGRAIVEYGQTGPGNRVVNNITFRNADDTPVMLTGTAVGNLIGVDPRLANFQPNGGGDYRLAAGSPAIDAASTACVPGFAVCVPPNDIVQGQRPVGSSADIGPYENGATPGSVPPPITPGEGSTGSGTGDICPQDVTGAGTGTAAGSGGAGSPGTGTTYYISPTGSNSNNGTSPSSPWQTFAYAFNPARAWCNKTLVLLDGTYGDGTATGKIDLNGANCTAGNALTIKAQNQRQAMIVDSGNGNAVLVRNSAYIIIDGLYARSTDRNGASGGQPFNINQSKNITIRNSVGRNPNRFVNVHIWNIIRSQDVLMEDNEGYVFHRHCAMGWESENVVFRRLYCNPRGGRIPGGYSTVGSSGSDTFPVGTAGAIVSMYPCKNCINENSIADGTTNPLFLNEMNSTYGQNLLMSGSKVLGSICYKCGNGAGNGIYLNARKDPDLNHTPQNITINNVAIVDFGGITSAIRASDGVNIDIGHVTVTSAGGRTGITADDSPNGATPSQQSIVIHDTTVSGLSGIAFNKSSSAYNTWSGRNLNSYNNGTLYSPGLPGNWGTTVSGNPNLGACTVWIPAGSPLKGKGTGGSDIGATILYRYENGTLTTTPLWDKVTGAFPHGAATPDGFNRVPGQSSFDVHKRLGVNSSGCPFPSDY